MLHAFPLLQYYPGMFDTSADSVRRREPVILLVILLLALIVRVPVLIRNPIPAGDGIASNIEVAENLRAGCGFSTMRKWTLYSDSMTNLRPEGNRQPLMAALLCVIFMIAGSGFGTAQILSLFIGIACLAACWLWVRRSFGVIPGLFSVLVLAITPLFVWYSVQPDSLLLFTGLFFVVLIAADSETLSFRRIILLGILTGLTYLTRTQGMLLGVSIGFWVLLKGGSGRIRKVLLFALVFILTCLPWFIRNIEAFDSPAYTQNSQFLLNENHWAAYEVRESAPGPLDMLQNQGPAAVIAYVIKGVLRVIEPVATGSLHRGEVFGQPSMVGFALLGLLALSSTSIRKKLLLPIIAALPAMAALTLHQHSGRYLAFFIVIVTGLGSAGLINLRRYAGKKITAIACILLLLPFALPLGRLLAHDSTDRAASAQEVSYWLMENSSEDDWLVTYPSVEMFIWEYRRPTLTMPNDYEMLLWPCLEEHGVRYIVIDCDLPALRPHLSGRWMPSAEGGWIITDPPPFLSEVYRSTAGDMLVYEMTGAVSEGFMHVDTLPRDNMRALPPAGFGR